VEGDAGAHYRVSRLRLSELLRDQPAAAWSLPVPACPEWDVQAAVSHVLGNIEDAMSGRLTGPPPAEQVAEQVARHADDAPGSLLDEWADAAATFEDFVSRAGAWLAVVDLLTHEQDVRGALDVPGAREEESMRLAARMLASAELPVTLVFDLGDERLTTSAAGNPTGETYEVACSAFEVTRIRLGRRSPEQVMAMAWEPALTAVPDGLFVFGPRTTPLVE
jgi:uncharacterized protein (TIGR03083 family)